MIQSDYQQFILPITLLFTGSKEFYNLPLNYKRISYSGEPFLKNLENTSSIKKAENNTILRDIQFRSKTIIKYKRRSNDKI